MKQKAMLIPELKVLDYAKSLDFYTRLAGFNVVYDRPENDFAMLGYKEARLMIEGMNEKSAYGPWGPWRGHWAGDASAD